MNLKKCFLCSSTGDVTQKPFAQVSPSAPLAEERKECYYNLNDANFCDNVLSRNTTKQECCCTVGAGWGDDCEIHACPVPGRGTNKTIYQNKVYYNYFVIFDMWFSVFLQSLMNFYFPDDYNKLCPHGSGLLPVSSAQIMGEQPPYIGTLALIHTFLSFYSFHSHKALDWHRKVLLTYFPSPLFVVNLSLPSDANECEMFGSEICKSGQCSNLFSTYTCYCRSGFYYDNIRLECVGKKFQKRINCRVIVFHQMKPYDWLTSVFASEDHISHELCCS